MFFYVRNPILQGAQAQGGIGVQEPSNERLAVGVKICGEHQMFLRVNNFLEQSLLVVALKRSMAKRHLI
jgi:hypothetical protein